MSDEPPPAADRAALIAELAAILRTVETNRRDHNRAHYAAIEPLGGWAAFTTGTPLGNFRHELWCEGIAYGFEQALDVILHRLDEEDLLKAIKTAAGYDLQTDRWDW